MEIGSQSWQLLRGLVGRMAGRGEDKGLGPCGQRQGQVAEDKVEVAWFERASSAMEGPRRSLQVVAKILQLDDVLPRLAHYRVESSGL